MTSEHTGAQNASPDRRTESSVRPRAARAPAVTDGGRRAPTWDELNASERDTLLAAIRVDGTGGVVATGQEIASELRRLNWSKSTNGTLYAALETLVEHGLLEKTDHGAANEYEPTAAARDLVARRGERMVDAVDRSQPIADGGHVRHGWTQQPAEPAPIEAARELANRPAVEAVDTRQDCRGVSVEVTLRGGRKTVPTPVVRTLARAGFAIADVSPVAAGQHRRVTARPTEGST